MAKLVKSVLAMLVGLSVSFAVASESGDERVSAAARQELAQVRQATDKYHDFGVAQAEGFVQVSPYVPNMGIHYASFPRLFGNGFVHTQPEVLIYVPSEDGLELVAAEYMVLGPAAPEGFSGHADHWHPSHALPGAWELHAWIWRGNPDGVFAHFNPTLP